jgi:site-specific recombinase XerD
MSCDCGIIRVKDIDYELKILTVRSGKGDKDRVTTFSATIMPFLNSYLAKARTILLLI